MNRLNEPMCRALSRIRVTDNHKVLNHRLMNPYKERCELLLIVSCVGECHTLVAIDVDLCDNVVKKRGEYLVCNSTCRFAYKERKRMVYDCQDTNLDLEVIVQHPKVIKHCV